jgi:hypothetical protein
MSDKSLAESLVNKLYGAAEIGGMIGTAAITEPFAGYAGLFNIGRGAEQATKEIEDVRSKYTYQPRSETARGWLESAAPYIEKAGKWIDRKATDLETATGGKIAREVTKGVGQFTLELSPFIAGKGIQIAKKVKARTKHIEDVRSGKIGSKITDKGPVQRNIEDIIPWEPTPNKPFKAADYPTKRGSGIAYHGGHKWDVDPKTGKSRWHPRTMGIVEDWLKSPGLYATNVKEHFDFGMYATKGIHGVKKTYGSDLPWGRKGDSTSHIIKTDYKNIMPNPYYLQKGEKIKQEILDEPSFMPPHDRDFFKLTNPEKRYWNKKHDKAKQIAISRGVPVGKDQSLHQYFYSAHGGFDRKYASKEVRDAKYKEMHDIRESYIAAGIDGIDFGGSTGAGLAKDGHEIVVFNPKVAESILQKTWAAKVPPKEVKKRWEEMVEENYKVEESFNKYRRWDEDKIDDPTRVGLNRYQRVANTLDEFNMIPNAYLLPKNVKDSVIDPYGIFEKGNILNRNNPTEVGFRLLDDLEKKLADRPIDRTPEIQDIDHIRREMKLKQEMLAGEGGVEFPMEVWKSEGYYDIFFHSNKVVPRRKQRTKPTGGAIPRVGKGGPLGRKKKSMERIAERDKTIAAKRQRDFGEVIETGEDIDPRTGSAVYNANTTQMIRDDLGGSQFVRGGEQGIRDTMGGSDFDSLRAFYREQTELSKIPPGTKQSAHDIRFKKERGKAAQRKRELLDFEWDETSAKFANLRNPDLKMLRVMEEGQIKRSDHINSFEEMDEIDARTFVFRQTHTDKSLELGQKTLLIDRKRIVKQLSKIEKHLEDLKEGRQSVWIDILTIEKIKGNDVLRLPTSPTPVSPGPAAA